MSVCNVDDILTSIKKVRADVAIVDEEIREPDIHCRFYSQREILVIVNAAHRLAKRMRIDLRDLEGEDFVLRALPSSTRGTFDQALQSAGVTVRPVMEIDSR